MHRYRPITILLLLCLPPLAIGQPHWAFTPPARPAPPPVSNQAWAANPIDQFVLARLEQSGMSPAPEADRYTLLRRLSLDLRGVPPSPLEIRAFQADESPRAYERWVDAFMDSPAYGERMAQNWFDLARFADTSGYAADRTRHVGPWRAWVIRAINDNMPYDQFTIEQLAGDMLPNATPDQKLASGFHRHAMQAKGNNPRKEEFRVKTIVDRLETTGRTWLGLTLECAECHDHKHDPISTEDYYRLYAIFNNIPHLGTGYGVHGPRMKYKDIEVPVMEEMPTPRETHIHVRGNFKEKGKRVTPGTPAMLPPLPTDQPTNRLTFARWLFSPEQPLTARVAVNRIWQHHFGEGLARTPADFGTHGDIPSHPELLDWLAATFRESGWNRKAIHRLIVMSSTYRQASALPREPVDPSNRLLARGARFRLHAEQIRDSVLSVSELLVERQGGPSVFPPQPEGLYEERGQNLPGNSDFTWKESEGDDRYRRSLYTYWKRMALHPAMAALDAPTRQVCVAKRERTNTPQQALVAMNETLFHEAANNLGRRLALLNANPDEALVRFVIERCLSRPATPREISQSLEFLRDLRQPPESLDEPAVWSAFAAVLLNLDEMMTRE